MTDRVLGELVALRQKLQAIASSPGVREAWRLTADVMPVLEPVWSLLSEDGSGVGFLRGELDPLGHAHNASVATEALHVYRSLDLVGPDMRAVWRAVSRPSMALLDSVRHPLPSRLVQPDGLLPARLGAAVRPALPGVLLTEWRDEAAVVPALRRVLRMWCDLARNAAGERGEVARLTLAAATLTRGAVLDGDTETVKWFVKQWLGMAATDTRVDGTSAALLEDGWHRRRVDEEFSVVCDSVTDLRIESMYQHRVHRPVWETQLRGAPVALLNDAVAISFQSMVSPAEAVVDGLVVQDVLVRHLTTQEYGIAEMMAQGRTSAEIASILGLSPRRAKSLCNGLLAKLQRESAFRELRGLA